MRSLIRGTTLYDVELPDDTEIVNVPSEYIPTGRYKVNKIKLCNPRQITDEMAFELVDKTKVVDEVWADIVGIVSIYGYEKTAKRIIEEHINKNNIIKAIKKTKEYLEMGSGFGYGYVGVNEDSLKKILELLEKKKKEENK